MTTYLYPFKRKLIVVTVISDLVTDYRVHKICQTLHDNGYSVLLTGSRNKRSIPLKTRDYQTYRLRTWFGKTFLFYAEFNIRLFLWFFNENACIFIVNELDIMPATMLLARLKKAISLHHATISWVRFDRKPLRRSVWKFIETRFFSTEIHATAQNRYRIFTEKLS
jgi:hypothetical protein